MAYGDVGANPYRAGDPASCPDRLPDASLDQIFRTARTRNGWTSSMISEALIREIYDTAKWGPTSSNYAPGASCS